MMAILQWQAIEQSAHAAGNPWGQVYVSVDLGVVVSDRKPHIAFGLSGTTLVALGPPSSRTVADKDPYWSPVLGPIVSGAIVGTTPRLAFGIQGGAASIDPTGRLVDLGAPYLGYAPVGHALVGIGGAWTHNAGLGIHERLALNVTTRTTWLAGVTATTNIWRTPSGPDASAPADRLPAYSPSRDWGVSATASATLLPFQGPLSE